MLGFGKLQLPLRKFVLNNMSNSELKRAFGGKNQQPHKLKVSGDGVFYSIQGEGPTMGKPAVFLRLRLCNLKCAWCDTRYTWDLRSEEFWTESQDWTVKETAKKIRKVWTCSNADVKKRLVITGGEPLIQQDNLVDLISRLPEWDIEIETNGTIVPRPELIERYQFNCCPKTSNSLNSASIRVRPEAINKLKRANTVFKFVTTCLEDVKEIEQYYIKQFDLDPNEVIIMPQGITDEEVRINAQKVSEVVKEMGYRLLLRLHIALWGAKRKV